MFNAARESLRIRAGSGIELTGQLVDGLDGINRNFAADFVEQGETSAAHKIGLFTNAQQWRFGRIYFGACRHYEEAVKLFEPYRELQEPYMPARARLKDRVRVESKAPLPRYIFVNNRF